MRRISKRTATVKGQSQQSIQQQVIGEEFLLAQAMASYASKVLHDAVEQITGKIVGAQSWGREAGFVRAGLTRVPVERPRIRAGGKEIEIPEYSKMQSPAAFTETCRRAIMGGLATRSFEKVGEALGSAKGLSKTTVSRVSKSFAKDFEKLMNQDLSEIVAVLIDGIYFSKGLCVIAAVGVNRFGVKGVVGLWAGETESAEVMKTVMSDLKDRNLNPKLFVIDGAKAPRAAIGKHFPWVPVQRCQVHKRRNIIDHVGPSNAAWAHLQMSKIFKAESLSAALALGNNFEIELSKINETAARSWREAFPETITVLQIREPELRRVLSSTNMIESIFSTIRLITGRVKRWRNANQALYWTSGGFFRIQPQLRRIRGFSAIKELDGLKQIGQDGPEKKQAA